MEIALVGGVVSLLNLLTLFMLGRATSSMDKLADKIDGKDGLNQRLTRLEERVHSCPTCRNATEK